MKISKKTTNKYGSVASWAVWGEMGSNPKSNMADMSVLDPAINKDLLAVLNPNAIMVALNFSREVAFELPYMNFHDPNPHAQDYKIRYAFTGSKYYGAYMTDLIKNYPMLKSENVIKYIRDNPEVIKKSIDELEEELYFIGSKKPIVFAFGSQVYDFLNQYLDKEYYSNLIKITHYSHYISKEKYKEEMLGKIEGIL